MPQPRVKSRRMLAREPVKPKLPSPPVAPSHETDVWDRTLPEIFVMGNRTLQTMSDVRRFVLDLPKEVQERRAWQLVAGALLECAVSGDLRKVVVSLAMAKMIDPDFRDAKKR